MGLYRDEAGLVFEADDRFGQSMGYELVSPAEEQDIYAQRGLAQRADDRGVIGDVNAGLTGVASGATLGLSDVALGEILPDEERKRLASDIAAHPYVRGAGELVGAVGSSLAAPGSVLERTPTGYLSKFVNEGVEHGLAEGGIAGVGKAIGAMGAEGAIQSGGQYIGHAALEDVDVTAEGLSGALGAGFAFGALGGGAALGVTKGVMEARRLFSRTMGKSDAKAAESAWTTAHQEALEADTANAQTAQAKVEEIRKAKAEALRYRNEARATTREEQIRAEAAGPAPKTGTPVPEVGTPAPAAEPFVGPEPLIDVTPPARDGSLPTSVFSRPPEVSEPTGVFKREPPPAEVRPSDLASGPATKVAPRPEPTELEQALAATKEQIDNGASLGDIRANKGNESNSIEQWLIEKADFSQARNRADIEGADRLRGVRDELREKPQYQPTSRTPFSRLRQQLTKQLLGPQIAREEEILMSALDEFEAARKDFMDRAVENVSFTLPAKREVPGDFLKAKDPAADLTVAGRPQKSIEALDTAHEEALMHAQRASDPIEAGKALFDAEELEKVLGHLTSDPTGPRDFAGDLVQEAKIIDRYERASAKLTEAVGDSAHPVSIEKAKAYAQASDDAVRKATDRATRAVDDSEQFGPQYATPKERVTYAKERQLEADKRHADVSADMIDAQDVASKAKAKLAASEKAKKAALRVDAKAARAAGKPGVADGILGGLGVAEILDLPGLPKVHDLPVVGPLLGAWLKYRTLKAALGRKAGRVAATADSRVAALAARTRDRIGRAVDRSLGAIERGGKYSSRITPSVAGILSNRIFDDGGDVPKKGAPLGELAAARIRELAAYVHTPSAIENDVRRQLQDVTDPDVIEAAEKHQRVVFEYLLANAPKAPEQGLINTVKWQPSPAESMSFARRFDAATDPAGVYERLAAQQAMLSLEAADALRTVYPQLFSQAQQRVIERLSETPKNIPYRTRVQMTLLYQLPFDAALSPDNLKISQSVYERKVAIPPPGAPVPPTPSVAGDTNLTALFQTTADRRAMR